jgi:hypothetical protein
LDNTLKNGGKESEICYLNFESLNLLTVNSLEALIDLTKEKITSKTKYIFLDEMQNISGWEKVVNALRSEKKYQIYITGSNSKMLSGEFATLLSGRYVNYLIQTFGFKEFCIARDYLDDKITRPSLMKIFQEYMEIGGFPLVDTVSKTKDEAKRIISDIYSTIVLKDVVERHKITDIDLLNRIILFVTNNIGNLFSANQISKTFKQENRKVNKEKIYNYLSYLEEAYFITRVKRRNIIGKELIKVNEKFYLGDHSFVFGLLEDISGHESGILENASDKVTSKDPTTISSLTTGKKKITVIANIPGGTYPTLAYNTELENSTFDLASQTTNNGLAMSIVNGNKEITKPADTYKPDLARYVAKVQLNSVTITPNSAHTGDFELKSAYIMLTPKLVNASTGASVESGDGVEYYGGIDGTVSQAISSDIPNLLYATIPVSGFTSNADDKPLPFYVFPNTGGTNKTLIVLEGTYNTVPTYFPFVFNNGVIDRNHLYTLNVILRDIGAGSHDPETLVSDAALTVTVGVEEWKEEEAEDLTWGEEETQSGGN